jgi:hypothetical protein
MLDHLLQSPLQPLQPALVKIAHSGPVPNLIGQDDPISLRVVVCIVNCVEPITINGPNHHAVSRHVCTRPIVEQDTLYLDEVAPAGGQHPALCPCQTLCCSIEKNPHKLIGKLLCVDLLSRQLLNGSIPKAEFEQIEVVLDSHHLLQVCASVMDRASKQAWIVDWQEEGFRTSNQAAASSRSTDQ